MKANINELKRLRYEERLTFSKIAKMFEVTRQNIQVRLKNAGGYESFTAVRGDVKTARRILLSVPQLSNKEIARLSGVSSRIVSKNRSEMSLPRATQYNYFWHWVDIKNIDECWDWKGNINPITGYGTASKDHQTVYAHRFAWENTMYKIPEEMNVCHSCDNPACCNPDHLFLGTQQDNVTDRDEKGRHQAPLNDEEYARDVMTQYKNGRAIDSIAKYHSVTRQSVYNIVKGRTYKHVFV